MAEYELLLACRDEEDLESGHKRKKEGDVICIKKCPCTWGKVAKKIGVILPVSGMIQIEVGNICAPLMDDGSYTHSMGDMDMDPSTVWEPNTLYEKYTNTDENGATTGKNDMIRENDKVFELVSENREILSGIDKPNFDVSVGDEVIDNGLTWVCRNEVTYKTYNALSSVPVGYRIKIDKTIFECSVEGTTGETEPVWPNKYNETIIDGTVTWLCRGKTDAKQIGKHRHNIPLNKLKTHWKADLDLDRVRDKSDEYQPFKSDGVELEVGIDEDIVYDKHFKLHVKKAKK